MPAHACRQRFQVAADTASVGDTSMSGIAASDQFRAGHLFPAGTEAARGRFITRNIGTPMPALRLIHVVHYFEIFDDTSMPPPPRVVNYGNFLTLAHRAA